MFDDVVFMLAHFPPKLVFADLQDMRQHKSRLIMEAQLMQGTPRKELSALLFQQAAGIELLLSELDGEDEDGPTRNDHLVSAASCFVNSGDFIKARELLPQIKLSDEGIAFFKRLPGLEETGARNALALKDAFVSGSLDGVRAAAARSWGTVPVSWIYWPLVRLASRTVLTADASEALKRLLIAYPMDLRFHLLYLSSSAVLSSQEAIDHARELTKAFPDALAAHVALATALVRAGDYTQAVSACERALDLVRQTVDAAKDPNSMVSMAFANASIALRRSGRREAGLDVLEEAVRRLPKDPELRTLYALALVADGDEQRAANEATIAANQVDEEDRQQQLRTHWPHTIAGVLALRRSDWNAALRLLDVAYKKAHGRARARNLNDLGVAFAHLGDAINAEEAFKAAIELAPDLEVAVRNLNRIRSESKQVDIATTWAEMEDDLFHVYQDILQSEERLAA